MATEYSTTQSRQYPLWPPDDTEESIVGSEWHQLSIRNLCLGINEIARNEAGPAQAVPFQAVSQATLLGLRRRDHTPVKAMPDVYVFKKAVDARRLSFSIRQDGPPALAVEVASDSTFDQDTDFEIGKGFVYAAAGITEYVTIDTSGLLQDPPLQAWRLRDGVYAVCPIDQDGTWWSAELPIGIAVRDGMVVIYDRARRAQLREGEIGTVLAQYREGMQRTILRSLQRRFGALPDGMTARIAALTDLAVLQEALDVVLDAETLAELERRLFAPQAENTTLAPQSDA